MGHVGREKLRPDLFINAQSGEDFSGSRELILLSPYIICMLVHHAKFTQDNEEL